MKKVFLVTGLLALAFLVGIKITQAQIPNNPFQIGVSTATHTACTVIAGTTQFCFANDGLWQSINGAAYVQVAPATAGVLSFNGRSGAVVSAPNDYSFSQISGVAAASQVPAPPVLSVNGKTGTVVLGATATAPSVTIQ